MSNDYAGMRDEYYKRFVQLKTSPGSAVDVAVCERCGCVPVPPDFICAGLCEACNDAYCDEHADDPDPEPGRRYTETYEREWTNMDWWLYEKFN